MKFKITPLVVCLSVLLYATSPTVLAAPFTVKTDTFGFMKTNEVPWKRVSISKSSNESTSVNFELILECPGDGQQVYFDEANIGLIYKSTASPNADAPSIFKKDGYASSVPDWRTWLGTTRLIFGNSPEKPLDIPLHEASSIGHAAGKASDNEISLKVSSGPSRPAEVEILSGASKAISNAIYKAVAEDLRLAQPEDASLSLSLMSASGRFIPMTFDLSGLKRSMALAIHENCKNP